MKDAGLDALIATKAENVTYATDLETDVPQIFQDLVIFALLSGDDHLDPTLILPTAMLPFVAARPNRVRDVRSYGYFNYSFQPDSELTGPEGKMEELLKGSSYPDMTPVELLAEVVKEKGLERGKIGLDERGISAGVKARVLYDLPYARFVDGFDLFRKIRMVKTDDEIEILRRAALINEEAIQHFLSFLAEGVTEKDLCREFHGHLIMKGAEKGHWNGSGGTRSGALFPASDYPLKRGDLFRFDVGCIYHNYFADTGGVCVLGDEPTREQKKIYRALQAGGEAALSCLRPGAGVSEVFNTGMEAVKKNGLPHYRRTHLGHGIGLEFYDLPLIKPAQDSSAFLSGDSDVALEEKMVVNIETPYYEIGYGGFQIERTLMITETGFEPLLPVERELFRVA